MKTMTKVSLKESIDSLEKEAVIAWDAEKYPPHLFPLYLFLLFKKKYCKASDVRCVHVDSFDFDDAICKCVTYPISPEYSVWIHIRKVWETALTFQFLIGTYDFVPIIMKGEQLAEIDLFIHTFEDAETTTEICKTCSISFHENNYAVLFPAKSIAVEIEEEFTKAKIEI